MSRRLSGPKRLAPPRWPGSGSLERPLLRLPDSGGDQLFGPVLQFSVQTLDVGKRVDFVRALVGPQGDDARESQGEARLVTRRTLDDVEGDFDHDKRLDLSEPAQMPDGVRLE